jgi:pimeloyl-ACP methyl ester carboxylesterase
MHYQITELASDHLVIAPDSRGHGRSTDGVGPLHYATMADDMIGLMDQLHIAKADVVGFSDGGITGLEMAMRHPRRIGRLVAIGANYDTSGMAYPVVARSPDDPSLAGARNFYLHASPTPAHWPVFYNEVIELWRTEPHIPRADLGRIQSPVLIMSGARDDIRRDHTDALARAIPNAREVIVPKAAHMAPIERPRAVNSAIRAFFAASSPAH